MSNRRCPNCNNSDNERHITAVLNDVEKTQNGDIYIGGCYCPVCKTMWDEISYPDGTISNVVFGRDEDGD